MIMNISGIIILILFIIILLLLINSNHKLYKEKINITSEIDILILELKYKGYIGIGKVYKHNDDYRVACIFDNNSIQHINLTDIEEFKILSVQRNSCDFSHEDVINLTDFLDKNKK